LIPEVDGKALTDDIEVKAMTVIGDQATGLGKYFQEPSSADLTTHQLNQSGGLEKKTDDRDIAVPIGFDVQVDVQRVI
jgi:hypothetical protein